MPRVNLNPKLLNGDPAVLQPEAIKKVPMGQPALICAAHIACVVKLHIGIYRCILFASSLYIPVLSCLVAKSCIKLDGSTEISIKALPCLSSTDQAFQNGSHT